MTIGLPIIEPAAGRPDYAHGPRNLESVHLLRISVTDRCNLRCFYCMPDGGATFFDRNDLLHANQILAVAKSARQAGIKHFKVTGGEPTLRPDLIEIIEGLAALKPEDLSMTTNGVTLKKLALDLKRAGLARLTISIDSLKPDRYCWIVGNDRYGLDDLWSGIDAATAAGFERLKINVVVLGGFNDDEVVDFARLSLDRPWTIRFIEYMPLGQSRNLEHGLDQAQHTIVDNAEVMGRIEQHCGPLSPVNRATELGVGPAQVYRLAGARGRLGFISAMSQPFCETCNRLRLTARGELRACLFDGGEVDIRGLLDGPGEPDPNALIEQMARCVAQKPLVHSERGNRAMSQMGG